MDSDLQSQAYPTGLSLYLHLPFCLAKCSYCDFFSVVDQNATTMGLVVDRLLSDTDRALAELGHPTIKTIYIGGGTPSYLPIDLLERLLTGLRSRLIYQDDGQFFTFEVNPESLTPAKLLLLQQTGVTRLSLGVQSFQDDLLQAVGRPVTSWQTRAALDLVKQDWPSEWSLDLIAGLPGQTERGQQTDLQLALDYQPPHLSFYSLTVEAGTALARQLRQGRARLPETADQQWLDGVARLQAAGYSQYEVSNFARPRSESRHNLQYWQLGPYLGLGPSAVSTLLGADGRPKRLQQPRHLATWLQAKGWSGEVEALSSLDFAKDNLMMELRLRRGLDLDRWQRRFGASLLDQISGRPAAWRSDFQVVDGYLVLSDRAYLQLDSLLPDLFLALDRWRGPWQLVWPD